MARVSTYLNFPGNAEEAFEFYRGVFRTEFLGPIMRMGDIPGQGEQLPAEERNAVMHIELPILGGHVIMATDMLESQGRAVRIGNNTTMNLEPDTVEEAQRLFEALSPGATDVAPLEQMFWGAWWGCLLDRYGIRWMFNVPAAS